MAGSYDGSLIFDTKIDTDGFTSGTNTIKRQADGMKSTFASLGKSIALVFGVRELIKFGKQAVDTASDLEEVQNVVDVAFKDMSYKMEQFAETAIDTFGISDLTAKQTGSTFMAMAKGMDIASGTASDMSISLTGLSADMASFFNKSQDITRTALNSIFTGETETLKQFGIVMTEVNLQNFAYQQGIKKKVSAMSQAEKVQLRYNYVMKQTALAQGDFARTSDSWANQTRILSERWKQFLGIMGKGLIQVLTPTVRFLNTALSKLISFANTVSTVLSELFGFDKTTATIESVGDSASDASNNIGDLGDSIEDAEKKANSGTAAFDKLNEISGSLSDTGGSVDIGIVGNTDTIITNKETAESANKVEDGIRGAADQLKRFADILEPLANFVAQGLIDFYNNFLKPVGKWVFTDAIPKLTEALGNLFKYVDWKKLNEALEKLWEALAPFAIAVGDGLIGFLKDASEFIGKGIGALLNSVADGLGWISEKIGGTNADATKKVGKALGELLGAVLLVKGFSKAGSILASIGTGIAKILSGVSKYSGVFAIVSGPFIAGFFADLFSSVTDAEKDALDEAILGLEESMDDLDEAIQRAKDNYTTLENENRQMEITVDAYFKLANKDVLTAEEQEQLKSYAKLLRENFPEELNGIIDEHTGKYEGTEQAIRDMIKAHQDYVMQVAAEEALVEINKKLIDAQIAFDKLDEERVKANKKWREKYESLPESFKDPSAGPLRGWIFNFYMKGEENHLREVNDAWMEGKRLLEEVEGEQKWYTEKVAEYNQKYIESANKTTLESGKALGGMSAALSTHYGDMDTTAKEKSTSIAKSPEEIVKSFTGNTVAIGSALGGMSGALETKLSTMETLSDGKTTDIAEDPNKIVKAYEDNLVPFSTAAEQLYDAMVEKLAPAGEDVPEIAKSMLSGFKKKIVEGKPGVIKEMGLVLADLEKKTEDTKKNNVKTIGDMMREMQKQIDTLTLTGPVVTGFLAAGMTMPKIPIPGYATGTVVPANNGEFYARLGDNSRATEVVSPLPTMKQAFKEAIAEIGGLSGNGQITLNVNLEGKQIYREVVKQDKETRNRTGQSDLVY